MRGDRNSGEQRRQRRLFCGGATFVFAKVEISFKEVERSQGRNILKAHQSETSLSNEKIKIEAILTETFLSNPRNIILRIFDVNAGK